MMVCVVSRKIAEAKKKKSYKDFPLDFSFTLLYAKENGFSRYFDVEHKEKAKELFFSGYNCAQAVVGAYHKEMGLSFEDAVRLASPFGGGMGRLREVCGAVSGMLLVLGALQGYTDVEDISKKAELYEKVQTLAKEFKGSHGDTYICRELLKDLAVNESSAPTPRTAEFYKTRPCAIFIEDACAIFDAFLEKQKKAD